MYLCESMATNGLEGLTISIPADNFVAFLRKSNSRKSKVAIGQVLHVSGMQEHMTNYV